MNVFRILVILASATMFSGCATLPPVDRDTLPPTQDDSIVVVGFNPERYALAFFPGEMANGKFRKSVVKNAAIFGRAVDGYIVTRVKAGQIIALTDLFDKQPEAIFARNGWGFCGGQTVPLLEVPKAQVLYIGTFDVLRDGSEVGLRFRTDLDHAVAHMRSAYPRLADALRLQAVQLTPTDRCPEMIFFLPTPVRR